MARTRYELQYFDLWSLSINLTFDIESWVLYATRLLNLLNISTKLYESTTTIWEVTARAMSVGRTDLMVMWLSLMWHFCADITYNDLFDSHITILRTYTDVHMTDYLSTKLFKWVKWGYACFYFIFMWRSHKKEKPHISALGTKKSHNHHFANTDARLDGRRNSTKVANHGDYVSLTASGLDKNTVIYYVSTKYKLSIFYLWPLSVTLAFDIE